MSAEHSPTPWTIESSIRVMDASDSAVIDDRGFLRGDDMVFAIHAANAHDELVAVLRMAMVHLSELRYAWERGAIHDCDNMTALRSNRNADVETAVRKALAKAEGREAVTR